MFTFVLFFLPVCFITLLFYFFKKKSLKVEEAKSNDVEAIYFGFSGLLYSLILAFVVVTVWEEYKTTNDNINAESTAIATLYGFSNRLPPAYQLQLKTSIKEYTNSIIVDEWETQKNGEGSPITEQKLVNLRNILFQMRDTLNKSASINFSDIILNQFIQIRNYRSIRIESSQANIPGVVWFSLILGSIICLAFFMIIKMENIKKHTLLVFLTTLLISNILFLTYVLDAPFETPSAIESTPFKKLISVSFEFSDKK